LDQVVERIVELDSGALTAYPGNYTYYRRQKEKAVCRINGSQLAPSPGT